MTDRERPNRVRCAIYTRVSTDQGLEQDFNSLDAQYEASQAYIRSQAHAGWTPIRTKYDDGGFSGGNTDRPALQRLLEDVRAGKIDIIVVYKVDRLTRSLADFAKLVELFDKHNVSFVSVTQQFNTTTSMGRLTLNVLLSFAQFEREVTSERIRDKIAASKRKGTVGRAAWPRLAMTPRIARSPSMRPRPRPCRTIFRSYLKLGSLNLADDRAAQARPSSPRYASSRRARPSAAFPSLAVRSLTCCATASISERLSSRVRRCPVSNRPLSIATSSRRSRPNSMTQLTQSQQAADAAPRRLLAGRFFDDRGQQHDPEPYAQARSSSTAITSPRPCCRASADRAGRIIPCIGQ